jgi:hypothetical protein
MAMKSAEELLTLVVERLKPMKAEKGDFVRFVCEGRSG